MRNTIRRVCMRVLAVMLLYFVQIHICTSRHRLQPGMAPGHCAYDDLARVFQSVAIIAVTFCKLDNFNVEIFVNAVVPAIETQMVPELGKPARV